jgi:hypothetical protein
MSKIFQIHQVFDFTQQPFEIHPDFIQLLERSSNAFIVLFVGHSRVGKSRRLNQLLNKNVNAEEPFKSSAGLDPVTKCCNVCNSIQLSELAQLHNITFLSQNDQDIFFIDSEGLASFDEETLGLRRSLFALTQISSVIVMVMKEQLNKANIKEVRSFFWFGFVNESRKQHVKWNNYYV